MPWIVIYHPEFDEEQECYSAKVQDALLTAVSLLQNYGPALGRPYADTLVGSNHANMKELRFRVAGGAWRVAFAFDPARKAVLLVGGDKAGVAQRRFYKALIAKADSRFDKYLARVGDG